MQLSEITQKHQLMQQEWDANEGAKIADLERLVEEAREQVERAKQRLAGREQRLLEMKRNYVRPEGGSEVIEDLAHALRPFFPGLAPKVLGPFGISCEYSIHFNHPTDDEQTKCLAVMIDELEITRRDYSVETKRFEKGTIGYANGLNHPTIPISPTATLAEIADLFK